MGKFSPVTKPLFNPATDEISDESCDVCGLTNFGVAVAGRVKENDPADDVAGVELDRKLRRRLRLRVRSI